MSRENVDVVRLAFEAYERGDIPGMLADLAPELITHRALPQPDAGTWHGPEGLLEALAEWTADFANFEMTAGPLTDANATQVVQRVDQRAIGRASGAPATASFWLVHTFSGGRIVRIDIYGWERQALEAVGLSE